MAATIERVATGINRRHRKACAWHHGRRCNCRAGYQANVLDSRTGAREWRTFADLASAKTWRRDALRELEHGTRRVGSTPQLREAAATWLEGAEAGLIRTRSGDRYKPSAIRSYAEALRLHVVPELGAHEIGRIRTRDLQALIEQLQAAGKAPSTIRNALLPVRAIYRRAVHFGDVAVNPTQGLELPAVRGKRDRIASPQEAAGLLSVLPEPDRALWAAALYAGLRLGELRALDWQHIDLGGGVIRIERSYDREAGFIEPKSHAGRRTVPIADALREHLRAHKLQSGRHAGLVFGRTDQTPFNPRSIQQRADKVWRAVELQRMTLHEARHTFASMMIAAGVNAKALSTYLGHSSVTITFDRYGHLMPGNEAEAASLLDTYLAEARGAQTL